MARAGVGRPARGRRSCGRSSGSARRSAASPARGRGRSGVERAIFAMVCQRCLEPASKLEATRWLGRDVVVDGIEAVSDDELYRAMDFLLACSERVQESVFFSVAQPAQPRGRRDLLRHHLDLLRGRRSTTPSDDDDEGGGERPLRRLGHSKDHRPDLPQVVIGLAVTREGIPVRVWVWPGNAQRPDAGRAGEGRSRRLAARPRDLRRRLRLLRPRQPAPPALGRRPLHRRRQAALGDARDRAGALPPGPLPHRPRQPARQGGPGRRRRRRRPLRRLPQPGRGRTRPRPPPAADRADRGRARPARRAARAREDARPSGRRTCAASARCATTRPSPATCARPRAAGSRSTGRRSPPRSGSTASTCSPPATRACRPRTSRSATSSCWRPNAPSATSRARCCCGPSSTAKTTASAPTS